ncbi:hypothetical protein HDU67_008110 [Dinochytrium kinnereticum]|nr:hypothetical protein HDU67_008110 [Dinochytrium kinnereticum]
MGGLPALPRKFIEDEQSDEDETRRPGRTSPMNRHETRSDQSYERSEPSRFSQPIASRFGRAFYDEEESDEMSSDEESDRESRYNQRNHLDSHIHAQQRREAKRDFVEEDNSPPSASQPPDEETLSSGIEALISAISSLPPRYFKYNAILKTKVNEALKTVDKLMSGLSSKPKINDREMLGSSTARNKSSGPEFHRRPSNHRGTDDRGSSKESETIRRALVLGRALTILKEVWMSAWESRAPLSRHYHVSDLTSVDHLHRAEHILHRYHLWRRVTETVSNPYDSSSAPLFRRSRSLSASRKHVDMVYPSDRGYLVQSLNNPSQISRSTPYNPAYLYLASSPINGKSGTVAFTKRWRAIQAEVRGQFMDAMLRGRFHRDEEMDDALNEVISSCRECSHWVDGEKVDAAEDYGNRKMWRKVADTVRREFSIRGRGATRFEIRGGGSDSLEVNGGRKGLDKKC